LAVPINLLAMNYESHDRSGNYVAWDYSYNILQTCEPGGIVFTNGDNDTFPLWYLQEVEGIRRDVRVICLSLLNTHWYIRQLRDQEPRVPMNLSDNDIDILANHPLLASTATVINQFTDARGHKALQDEINRLKAEKKLPSDYDFRRHGFPFAWWKHMDIVLPVEDDTLRMRLEPVGGNYLRVQDYLIFKIIQSCRLQRPVYFAVTVSNDNRSSLDRYLRMDGLAFKVMPDRDQEIKAEIMQQNLLEKYRYRGLNDEKVHLDLTTLKMLQNYRLAYMSLAQHYIGRNQKEQAASILDAMTERMPEHCIPHGDERAALMTSQLFREAGRPADVDRRVQHVIPGRMMSREERLDLGAYYAQVFHDWEKAENALAVLIEEDPEDVEAYAWLVQTYRWSGQHEKGIRLLEDWLERHPGDRYAQRELNDFKQRVMADTAVSPGTDGGE